MEIVLGSLDLLWDVFLAVYNLVKKYKIKILVRAEISHPGHLQFKYYRQKISHRGDITSQTAPISGQGHNQRGSGPFCTSVYNFDSIF